MCIAMSFRVLEVLGAGTKSLSQFTSTSTPTCRRDGYRIYQPSCVYVRDRLILRETMPLCSTLSVFDPFALKALEAIAMRSPDFSRSLHLLGIDLFTHCHPSLLPFK